MLVQPSFHAAEPETLLEFVEERETSDKEKNRGDDKIKMHRSEVGDQCEESAKRA